MIILGIDPGLADTGYGIVQKSGQQCTALNYGSITTPAGCALPDRLQLLYNGIIELIAKHNPQQIGIEALFFAKNAKTAILVSHARGVAMLAAKQAGCEIREFTPLQIKQALTGYGRADKNQIQQMVKTILKLDAAPQPNDAADALAVAICCGQTNVFKDTRNKLQ